MSDTPSNIIEPQGTTIRLYLNEDGTELMCEYDARGDRQPINSHWIRGALADHGFGDLFLLDDPVAELVENYNNGQASSRPVAIAERRDAGADVRVSEDKMAAFIYTTPPYGGSILTEKAIRDALMRKGVVYGVITEEFPLLLTERQVSERLIAKGRNAERGEDARFESLIPEARKRKPSIGDRGVANYRDLGDIVMVRPGDPVMRRVPPTPGSNGQNVLGQAILAEPGKEMPWAKECEGVAIDDYDENILIATVAGRPVIIEGGIKVEDTFRVKNVDLSTGNLAFDGSIQIDQDVKIGMRVRATGNVKINGSVESATIEADGDIIINGGIIGFGDLRDKNGQFSRNIAHIKAGGRVAAHFVQNACIEAKGEVVVTRMIAHSEVTSTKLVQVGKTGSKVGNIIGGVTRALIAVRAQTLGSPAGVTTRIEVGVDPELQEQLDLLEEELTPKKDDLTKMIRLIGEINKKPDAFPKSTRDRAQQSFQQLKAEISELGKRREQLRARLKLIENARIVAERTIHGSVELRIGDAIRYVTHDLKGDEYCLKDEEIEVAEKVAEKGKGK